MRSCQLDLLGLDLATALAKLGESCLPTVPPDVIVEDAVAAWRCRSLLIEVGTGIYGNDDELASKLREAYVCYMQMWCS